MTNNNAMTGTMIIAHVKDMVLKSGIDNPTVIGFSLIQEDAEQNNRPMRELMDKVVEYYNEEVSAHNEAHPDDIQPLLQSANR